MSRNVVLFGDARLVMTMIWPVFWRMNSRLVSPGGCAMHTGSVNVSPERGFGWVRPKVGGAAGMGRVVFAPRVSGPASAGQRPARRISKHSAGIRDRFWFFID